MPVRAYVGSYTPNGDGITLFEMNSRTGTLRPQATFGGIVNPTWLALDQAGTHLYALHEIEDFGTVRSGAVSAFAVDRASGALRLLNTVGSGGAGPAHLCVHPSGRFVLVANYGSGGIAALPVLADGTLGEASDVVQDEGTPGPSPATDAAPGSFAISGHDGPHAHTVRVDPSGRFVLHTDLGLDRIYLHTLDPNTGRFAPHDPPFVAAAPGAGPRHMAFHPNRRLIYTLNETASTLTAYAWDAKAGSLRPRQTVSTLPPGFAGTSFGSELVIGPAARFLYAANRLHDSVAILGIGAGGRLAWIDAEWTRGDYPRHIAIDPSGHFLFACNHRGDQITCFRISRSTGKLRFTGEYTPVGSPAMLLFASTGES